MHSNKAMSAARYLLAQHRDRRPFTPIPSESRPGDAAEAFAAQAAFQSLLAPTLGEVIGYKVALTTPVMQQMVGYNEPIPGAVFASTVHASGERIRADDFNHLGIECELALRLGRDLEAHDAPFDRDGAASAVAEVMAAFELVDDRSVDYQQFSAHVLSFIADNAWNAGVVLGDPMTHWRDLDLASIQGRAELNGADAGIGHGRDVMGHPLDALAWLANALAARDRSLVQGMLVMTGSIIATRFVTSGDEMTFRLGPLAPVRVQIA